MQRTESTLATIRQAKHEATLEAEAAVASGRAPARISSPVTRDDLKAARAKAAAAKLSSEKKAAKEVAARRIEDVWTAQLRQVLAEIEREVQDKADRQREGVSRVEVLSVHLENDCVMEAEEIQRRLTVRGKMVDELHTEMVQMRESLIRVHGSRISEMATHSSRFVDYPALEKRLEVAEKTLRRLELECPALEAQMPAIVRGIEEFEDRRRETDRLVESCWKSAQSALDKYSEVLCADFDRALAPSTANLEALRAEMARCQYFLWPILLAIDMFIWNSLLC